ncbi:TPA: NUDIX domain-containing protein [Klebsiella aerogenes]
MRTRPASRLIVLSPENHVLLYSFCHKDDALEGKTYWATPGGGLEHNESFEQAALRELFEEMTLRCLLNPWRFILPSQTAST